ncbi:hypothetical protein [Bullifex porci]|uniref:hypothetical protein n=1 Tax=Bullifex porci TaxID=2606638 RepID=UPI0023F51CB0|nr:hypothetical protein [Bullifex porci]MDD7255368.1 hypothetical protein [Bullifex porci]MDY2740215.1 hypothetical protein [Bullifex porci]
MKKLLIIILTIVSLVALASCNIPTPIPPVIDELNDVLKQEPTINQIDEVLDKIFSTDGSPVSLGDEGRMIFSFKIIKESDESYKLDVLDEENISFPITVTDNKYFCDKYELIISDDFKKITINENEYGTTE